MNHTIEITDFQMDALREHLNIGMGVAAGTLNQMLNTRVKLQVPEIKVVPVKTWLTDNVKGGESPMSSVNMAFRGNVSGSSSVVFDQDSAARLVKLLVPESEISTLELNSITEATLSEVGNIIINAVMGSLANLCHFSLKFHPPFYSIVTLRDAVLNQNFAEQSEESIVIIGDTYFNVEQEKILGRILIVFLISQLKDLLNTWSEKAA